MIGGKLVLAVKDLRASGNITGCACTFVHVCIVSAPLRTENCWPAAAKVL